MGLYTKKIYEALGLEEKEKNVFYGHYHGYELTVVITQQINLFLNFYCDGNVKLNAINIFQKTTNQSMVVTGGSVYGLCASVNGMTFASSLKKTVEKLDATIAYLSENGALGVGCCPCCGETLELMKPVRVNDCYVTLSEKCFNELQSAVEVENETFESLPNNYLKGFLGALLGAVVGGIAWYILYMIGFLSALTAVLAVFLGNMLYVKFGGKPNGVKNIIVAATSLIVLVLTCVLAYYFVVGDLLLQNNIYMDPFEFIFSDAELKGYFISDMVMNVVFTLLGVGIQIYSTKKKDQTYRTKITK